MTTAAGTVDPPPSAIAGTVGLVAAIWIVSDVGYYYLFPALGLTPSYNDHPVWSAVYYVAWTAVTLVAFRRTYRGWTAFDGGAPAMVASALLALGFAAYAICVPPLLPVITWTETWAPPDILLADPWYFLPKSADILFQQLLIVVLVLALAAREHDLRRISVLCAMLFGGTHLLLVFGGLPLLYVIRFTIFATLFGFLFPYLILRVRNGLVWSYSLHWVYYAATLLTAHYLSPYAAD